MSTFLNQSQITTLTGTFARHFEQFSSGINNFITVYKEPLQIINNNNSVNLAGYGTDSMSNTDITYQEVSSTFPAMIINSKNISSEPFAQLNFPIDKNDILIKVDDNVKDYITRGKTERVIVNGQSYNTINSFGVQNYFGLKYYYFKLNITV